MLLAHQPPEVRIARAAHHPIEGQTLLRVRLVHLIAVQVLLSPSENAGQQGVSIADTVFEIASGHIQGLPVGDAAYHKMGVRVRPVVVIRGYPLQLPAQVPLYLMDEGFDKGGALVP